MSGRVVAVKTVRGVHAQEAPILRHIMGMGAAADDSSRQHIVRVLNDVAYEGEDGVPPVRCRLTGSQSVSRPDTVGVVWVGCHGVVPVQAGP